MYKRWDHLHESLIRMYDLRYAHKNGQSLHQSVSPDAPSPPMTECRWASSPRGSLAARQWVVGVWWSFGKPARRYLCELATTRLLQPRTCGSRNRQPNITIYRTHDAQKPCVDKTTRQTKASHFIPYGSGHLEPLLTSQVESV